MRRGRHQDGGPRSATGCQSTGLPHAIVACKTQLAVSPANAIMPADARPGASRFPKSCAKRRAVPARTTLSAVSITAPAASETRYAAIGALPAARPKAVRHLHPLEFPPARSAKFTASRAQPARGIARRRARPLAVVGSASEVFRQRRSDGVDDLLDFLELLPVSRRLHVARSPERRTMKRATWTSAEVRGHSGPSIARKADSISRRQGNDTGS